MGSWRNSLLLVFGIGVSNLGNWIYLVAINILILDLTGSAAAVAGLFIIRPLAVLLTNTWSGSYIDRLNKRKLMIITDIIRGLFIAIIPFMSSLWAIYVIMLLVNIAGSFFGPTSIAYITKLVPEENRKRFNSFFSFANSGAFLIGPSISGVLILSTSVDVCIYINAVSFFICAIATCFLPEVDKTKGSAQKNVSFQTILNDWREVVSFSKRSIYFISIYLVIQIAMLIGFALDSQEATFIRRDMNLTEADYGLLISISGAASLLGSVITTVFANRISLRMFIGLGMILSGIGYLVFYLSSSFLMAAIGFVIFGIFFSFASTGYTTFFQNHVPAQIMGRFVSTANLVQGFIQIVFTLVLGFLAEIISLQTVCIAFACIAIVISFVLAYMIFLPSKIHFYYSRSEQVQVK